MSGRFLDGFAPVAGLATAMIVAPAVSVTVVPRGSQQGGLASMQFVGPKQLLYRKVSRSLIELFAGSTLDPLSNRRLSAAGSTCW